MAYIELDDLDLQLILNACYSYRDKYKELSYYGSGLDFKLQYELYSELVPYLFYCSVTAADLIAAGDVEANSPGSVTLIKKLDFSNQQQRSADDGVIPDYGLPF